MFQNLDNFLEAGYCGEMRATIDAMNNQDRFRQGLRFRYEFFKCISSGL